jgi:hypothetical protein
MDLRIGFLLGILLAIPAAEAQEKPKVNCVAENFGTVVMNAQTKKTEEIENWKVTCNIKQGDKILHEEKLVLPYPASYRDAMDAIEDFRKNKAPKILKEKK